MSTIGFVFNVTELARQNQDFRRIVYTQDPIQLTVMSLDPGQSIGLETHPTTVQLLSIVSGQGFVVFEGKQIPFTEGFVVVIQPGVSHDVINTSTAKPLKMWSMYSPPQHTP